MLQPAANAHCACAEASPRRQTRKQTAPSATTYREVFRSAASSGGGVVRGVMMRGLGTKVCASAANGVLFTVMWNWAQDRMLPPLQSVAVPRGAAS